MNDELRADATNRYGHFALARDSSDVVEWVHQHALEHSFELDAAQSQTLQHFQRTISRLTGMQTRDRLSATHLP